MTTREQYEDWFRGYYKQEPMPELGAPAHDFCWAGYIAGAASRDAEVAKLNRKLDYWRDMAKSNEQLADINAVVMHESDVTESYRAEADNLHQQLSDHIKREVMLRDLIPKRIPDGFVSFGKYYAEQESIFNPSYKEMTKFKNKYLSDCEEALAATADLDGLILCDAVEVGWIGTGPRDGRCEFSESKPANSVMRDFNMKPLYRAWEPTK